MIVTTYLIIFVIPYADIHNFFNENEIPNHKEIIKYSLLCFPVVIGYFLFGIIYIRRTTFLMCLNYPLFIINIYIGFWLCLLVEGGAILWVAIPSLIIPIIVLPISFYKGLLKDIQFKYKDQ